MTGRAGRRGGRLARPQLFTAAAVLLFSPGFSPADEFFAVHDENPLIRGFYLPLPSGSRLSDGTSASATLSISNTLNLENRGLERVLLDGESDVLAVSFDHSLAEAWRFRFTVPIIHDSGGFLDSAIDHWHRWFGFDPGNRPYYPRNEIIYAYSGLSSVGITDPQSGVGDFSGELGWYPIDDSHRTLSIWGGLAAPTGSASKLMGDGAWNGAAWAHAALRWLHWQLAAEMGVAQPFGDEIFAGKAHKTSVFGRVAATRILSSAWSLRAQLDGQTKRVNDSDLRLLGPSLLLTIGAVHRLSERWHIEFGIAEDAAVNTAPDVTFFLGLRRQSGAK